MSWQEEEAGKAPGSSEQDRGQSEGGEPLEGAAERSAEPKQPPSEQSPPEGQVSTAGQAADLEEQIKALTAERDDYLRRLQRAIADGQNQLKRLDRMTEQIRRSAINKVVRQVLPLADSLALARDASEQTQAVENLREGLRVIEKEFYAILAGLGVEAIEAVGKAFDPQYHEAVLQQAVPGVEPSTVVKELKKGFVMGGEVIRPSQVAVAAPPLEVEQDKQPDERGRNARR